MSPSPLLSRRRTLASSMTTRKQIFCSQGEVNGRDFQTLHMVLSLKWTMLQRRQLCGMGFSGTDSFKALFLSLSLSPPPPPAPPPLLLITALIPANPGTQGTCGGGGSRSGNIDGVPRDLERPLLQTMSSDAPCLWRAGTATPPRAVDCI